MADDPAAILPPVGDPPPPSRPAREPRACCEFCECELTARGEVLRLSDKAKKIRDRADEIDALTKKIAALETDLSTVRAEKAALEGKKAGEAFSLKF